MTIVNDWRAIVAVAAGGSLGCLARFAIGTWTSDRLGAAFPYATLLINVTGSFLIGLVVEYAETRSLMTPLVRLLVVVGFCGGYTTFSTFAYETVTLNAAAVERALLYIGVTIFLGLGATYVGIAVARLL